VITESDETDNTGSNTVTVSAPNLTITKTNTISDAVALGNSFTWTMTIANSGSSAADFATDELLLTDTLPLGADYTLSASYPSNVSCSIVDGATVADPKTFSCKATAPLSIASAGTLVVTLEVTPTSIGSLANTVTVDPNDVITESDETDNTGSNTLTVNAPNLTISKTNNVSGNVVIGNSFTWTILVTNNGTSDATFAFGGNILTDTLPISANYSISSSPASANCAIDGSLILTCTAIGSGLTLIPSTTFEVQLSVTPTATGNLNNTAIVDGSGLITESDESDNSSKDIVAVNAKQIDLELTKTVNNATPAIGDNVIFTLTVTNNGSDDASGVVVQDLLPSGYTYVTDSEVGNLDSYNSSTGIWTVENVASTGSVSLDIEATVNATGNYKNVAEVTAANETDIDSTPNNDNGDQSEDDEAAASVTVPNMLGLAKRVDSMTETSTGTYQISYEFLVKNYGAQDLDNLQITDDLNSIFTAPTTYSVISLSTTDFTVNNSFDGNADSNLLVGTETLTAGSTGTVQLVIEVIPYEAGPFDNVAIATATHSVLGSLSDNSHDGADPDGNSNGTPTDDSDPTPVSFGPNLFDPPIGFKWLDADNNPILTWTMVWINNSNIVAINAEAYDEIPVGTVFYDNGITSGYPVPASAPAGSTNTGVTCTDSSAITTTTNCYYEAPSVTYPRGRIVWIGNLGPDLNQTSPDTAVNDIAITFSVRINQSNAVTNIAYINSDLNGDGDVDDVGELQVASATASWGTAKVLPESGFEKDQVSDIGKDKNIYTAYNAFQLRIEKLGIQIPIVGVPQENSEWDVTWLGNQAGWLQNTAFPTSQGNSAITGHVYNQYGLPGPFIDLKTLRWGDEIVIIENGQEFVYKVNDLYLTKPNIVSSLANSDETMLTLITCQNYDETNHDYLDRLIVTAKLIEVR
jgi:LPXTG-site transpeptidase (sortase) family protein